MTHARFTPARYNHAKLEAIGCFKRAVSFSTFAKTSLSFSALLIGLGFGLNATVRAASPDSLRPRPVAPSLLDPQSDKEQPLELKLQNKAAPKGAASQSRVNIKSIRLIGNKVFTTDELMTVLTQASASKSLTGQMTFAEIQALSEKLTDHYRQAGYLVAQAVLPHQDVTEGNLTILIVEGRLDGVTAARDAWNKNNQVVEGFRKNYTPEKPAFTNDDLQRALSISGEATGNINRATLKPSSQSGGSDIEISTKRLPLLFYGFSADNMGNKSTGVYRVNPYIGGNSWLIDGDRTRFEFGTSNEIERSNRFDLSYTVPVGLTAWSAGARAWTTRYDLGGTFSSTKSTGVAHAGEVFTNYALQRSENARADWKTGFSYIYLSDKVATGSTNNERHLGQAWSTLAGYNEDSLLGTRARNTYTVSTTVGNLTFDDATARASDAKNAKTAGSFGVVSVNASREQILFDQWSVYGLARGQKANTNLDSYNKMSLGGPTAVRAYAGGEAAGDNAAIVTTELRYLYSFNLFEQSSAARIAAFYDRGWAEVNVTPVVSTTPTRNDATRSGYGAELNIFWSDKIGWQIYWAHVTDPSRFSQVDGRRSRIGTSLSGTF